MSKRSNPRLAEVRRYLRRVKQGRCGECGRLAVPGRTLCSRCLKRDDNEGVDDAKS